MRNLTFYPKLALRNISKNSKFYWPYLLSCVLSVMMFYIMFFIASNRGLLEMPGSSIMPMFMGLGCVIIALFTAGLLFYTNNYLMKQRQKELGLYNILGMDKRNLSQMLFFESLIIMVIALGGGIISGALFSRLVFLMLSKVVGYHVPFTLNFSLTSASYTMFLYTIIFIAILIYNLFHLHVSKPIELLKGGNVGEKEPKAKVIGGILGILSLVAGYYLALTARDPITAITMFFVAVLLVIAGTFLLFQSTSIVVLKMLKNNKTYYYKPQNFLSVSTLMYRMKQNAKGLANICILSTMVIVMVAGTLSLYAGMNNILDTRYPYDLEYEFLDLREESTLQEAIQEQAYELAKEKDITINEFHFNTLLTIGLYQEDNEFISFNEFSGAVPDMNQVRWLRFMTLEDYNIQFGHDYTLQDGELFLQPFDVAYPFNDIKLFNQVFPLTVLENDDTVKGEMVAYLGDTYLVIVKDYEALEEIEELNKLAMASASSSIITRLEINLDAKKELHEELYNELKSSIEELIPTGSTTTIVYSACKTIEAVEVQGFYGGFFFLGVFLGILFIMAMVLIMYYKQIVEGFDDKERFKIMRQVGLSEKEIKQTINSQVIKIFSLPLVVAIIHYLFAFPIIVYLLQTLGLYNVSLFATCSVITCVIFAIIYGIVYVLTAKTYYKLISA